MTDDKEQTQKSKRRLLAFRTSPKGDAAVLGSHASRLNGGNLRTALAPQVEQVA
ncbi:MAG: hypothetical protein KME40_27255 [Komarekiella atlantica HA4396-MV6]|nr:hypothetical protein [Komarekiella atlantica HA4396-MV6]